MLNNVRAALRVFQSLCKELLDGRTGMFCLFLVFLINFIDLDDLHDPDDLAKSPDSEIIQPDEFKMEPSPLLNESPGPIMQFNP
jgi:hypothetical protein